MNMLFTLRSKYHSQAWISIEGGVALNYNQTVEQCGCSGGEILRVGYRL